MKKFKLQMAMAAVVLTYTSLSLAAEKTFPISEVDVDSNRRGDTIILADSIYPTPCYDVSSKTAVVNTFSDTIILKQKFEKTDQVYCNQVITAVTLEYNLGDVPDGKYEVIDSYDKSLIDKITIKSADKRTINNRLK